MRNAGHHPHRVEHRLQQREAKVGASRAQPLLAVFAVATTHFRIAQCGQVV